MKRLTLLGSTGSIGTQTIDVIASRPGEFRVVALTGGRNLELLANQARMLAPELVVVSDASDASAMAARLPAGTRVLSGRDGLVAAARHPEADLVVCGLVGALG